MNKRTKDGERSLNEDVIINKFKTIYSVGDIKARQLFEAGARSIKDLSQPRFLEMLTPTQQLYLSKYELLTTKKSYSEVEKFVRRLNSYFKKFLKLNNIEGLLIPAGSFRRGLDYLNDLDVIVSFSSDMKLGDFIEFLSQKGFIDKLSQGEKKFLGIASLEQNSIRIDIILSNQKELPYALVYFTGSKNFVKKQRAIAKNKGFRLNEFRMLNLETGEEVTASSEEEIFNILDMDYLEPSERN